ncbi:hypothetical protein Q8F55_001498 [Vanrija albida]|uniref:Extracellular membrane protein CFEM domain-containing protein n=1 Tax=Vanrija albida TaxID=181172 RepID=A0ABR3QH66_9TREE
MSSTTTAAPFIPSPARTISGIPMPTFTPTWKEALKEWELLCAADVANVTDKCCAEQHGSLWVDNATTLLDGMTLAPGPQHNCLLYPTNRTTSNATWFAFVKCVNAEPAAGIDAWCVSGGPKKSGGKRVAAGLIGLVWLAAGCALAL